MKVRYNPVVGIIGIVLGAVCVFLGLWLLMLGEFSMAAVVGFVPLLVGVLYLVRPYFWVHSKYVVVPALLGPATREVPYETLEVEGRKLIAVRADGTRKKVPVARWISHSSDWADLTRGLTTPAGQ